MFREHFTRNVNNNNDNDNDNDNDNNNNNNNNNKLNTLAAGHVMTRVK